MILGIGTDILNISRIKEQLSKFGDSFAKKVLSADELAKYNEIKVNSTNYLAKKFCAKEAFSKALGTGIGGFVSFQDISVKNDELGKPYIVISDELLKRILQKFNIGRDEIKIDVSLSDDEPFVVGFVVVSSG